MRVSWPLPDRRRTVLSFRSFCSFCSRCIVFLLGILVALSVDFGSIIYDVLVSIVMHSRAAAKTIVKKDVSYIFFTLQVAAQI